MLTLKILLNTFVLYISQINLVGAFLDERALFAFH